MRRIANNVGVFVGLVEPIENAYVFLVGVNGLPVVDDFPELDAPFRSLPFLLHEALLIRPGTHKLIIEGVKVDGENAVLGAVPPHFR